MSDMINIIKDDLSRIETLTNDLVEHHNTKTVALRDIIKVFNKIDRVATKEENDMVQIALFAYKNWKWE